METLITLAKPLLFILIVLLLYFFCIKPLMGMMEETSPSSQKKSPPAGHAEDDTGLHLPPKKLSDQERLHRLAQSDPERAKELIRQWLRDDDK